MIILAQLAAAASTDSIIAEAAPAGEKANLAVREALAYAVHEMDPDLILPIVAVVSFFAFLLVAIVLLLVFRYVAAKRQARLVELAIQNNQTEIARELIAVRQKGRRWGLILLALVIILAVGGGPIALIILAVLFVVAMVTPPERRPAFIRNMFNGKKNGTAPPPVQPGTPQGPTFGQ